MHPRNQYEIKLMQRSGIVSAKALKRAMGSIKIGVTELEIDEAVKDEVYKNEGDLSYKTVPGYNFASCITVNEEVVHGIPTDRKFTEGDIVSVDLASMFKGWHTDCAWTILLGKDDRKEKFLKIGEQALWEGIDQAKTGNRVGDISAAIQSRVEGAGYHIVRSLVGHGVGRSLHEDPEIPGYGKKGTGPVLKKDATVAIEVIYGETASDVVLQKDGWTYSIADGSLGGLFEMTVVVGKSGGEVLTDWRSV